MTESDVAVAFLRSVLADGPVAVAEVHRLAVEQGIRPTALDAARPFIRVRARQDGPIGGHGAWFWFLSADPEGPHAESGAAAPPPPAAADEIAHKTGCRRPAVDKIEGLNDAGQYVIVLQCQGCHRRHVQRIDWGALAQLGIASPRHVGAIRSKRPGGGPGAGR